MASNFTTLSSAEVGIYYDIPTSPSKAKPILQRFLRENAAVASDNLGGRRRPDPPRSPILQAGSLEVLVTWNAPQNARGILGFNIYAGDETNRILNVNNPATRQAKIKLPAATVTAFYISSYNASKESVKVRVPGLAKTDQYVVSGTSGGTGGTSPSSPGGWSSEPTGGSVHGVKII